jgi:predicted RNA methylase
MNRQRTTPASLTSSAANSKQKGLQQYFTPQNWALAIGAALPPHRRTLFDPFCGNGSLVRGLANDTTRDVMGLDLDPSATLGKETAWAKTPAANARRHFAHGDVLDLLPLLEETGTKFDLMALNPPFSLEFPIKLLPEPLRAGIKGKTINSTHLAVRMATRYIPTRGECVLIANASTIQKLQYSWPDDFSNCWAIINVPSFFPGTDPALKIAIAYFSANKRKGDLKPYDLPITNPEELAAELQLVRSRHHSGSCIDEPFHQQTDTHSAFDHCVDEMDRRRNPSHSNANIILDDHGRLRTWVSGYQQRSLKIPHHLTDFLRRITRTYPAELTIQPATRAALRETLDSGIWTIDPAAAAAISAALDDFSRDRAPLAPLNLIQRIGWLDENETILCVEDFQCFRAGKEYPLTSQTVEWKKTSLRPRYRAGVRDEEEILTKGTDLQLTIIHENLKHHFTYCPASMKSALPGRDSDISQLGGGNHHTLEDLAAHFYIPEVPDITATFPEQFQANLALLDELETITP